MQAGAAGERRRAKRTAPVQDLQAVQVRVVEVQVRDDLMVEQRELDVQLAQRLLDLRGQAPAAPGSCGAVPYFGLRMICISYYTNHRTSLHVWRQARSIRGRAARSRRVTLVELADLGQSNRHHGCGAHRDREPAREHARPAGAGVLVRRRLVRRRLVRRRPTLCVTAVSTPARGEPVLRVPGPGVPARGGAGACRRECGSLHVQSLS
jgi:hypothetical protein